MGEVVAYSMRVVRRSTVDGNSGLFGGGLNQSGGTLTLQATIVASSEAGGDCYGVVTDDGYNVDDDGTCGFTLPSLSDYATLSTTLGPLANNGGTTETIALLAGSPAIGYVHAADCPTADQRGYTRPAPCDIGAYDSVGTPPSGGGASGPDAQTPEVPSVLLLPLSAAAIGGLGVEINRPRRTRQVSMSGR